MIRPCSVLGAPTLHQRDTCFNSQHSKLWSLSNSQHSKLVHITGISHVEWIFSLDMKFVAVPLQSDRIPTPINIHMAMATTIYMAKAMAAPNLELQKTPERERQSRRGPVEGKPSSASCKFTFCSSPATDHPGPRGDSAWTHSPPGSWPAATRLHLFAASTHLT